MITSGFIPPRVHGVIGYLAALVLIVGPFVLDFGSDTATWLSVVIGIAIALGEAATNWSTGLVKVLPPAVHGVVDYAVGVVLIVSPFVFGFNDEDDALWFFLVMGAGELIAALATRFVYDEGSRLDRDEFRHGGRASAA
jgi:hypothetical protein